jgi:hypothetical protein
VKQKGELYCHRKGIEYARKGSRPTIRKQMVFKCRCKGRYSDFNEYGWGILLKGTRKNSKEPSLYRSIMWSLYYVRMLKDRD